jgi:hypothetical protein
MKLTMAIISLALSGGIGVLAFLAFRSAYRKTSTWHRAVGVIVGFTERARKGRTSYFPQVEFTTPAGESFTFTSSVGSGRRSRIHRKVRVLFSPDDPSKAIIASFVNLWFLPAFLCVFVVMFAALSIQEFMKLFTQP